MIILGHEKVQDAEELRDNTEGELTLLYFSNVFSATNMSPLIHLIEETHCKILE